MKVDAINPGDDVWLAPLLPEHVSEAYVSWLNDPIATLYTTVRGTHDLASTRDYVIDANNDPNAAIWRILVDDDVHIGNIRLSAISFVHRRSELALLIGNQDYWGRGIGTKAIDMATNYALEVLNLHKVICGIIEPNVGSHRMLEKAGFHVEGTLRDQAVLDGEFHDSLLYARFNPIRQKP